MNKGLLFVTVLCFAAAQLCLADETAIVEPINTVICQERVQPSDLNTQVTRMQDCLRQKRFENMVRSRAKRSQPEWTNQLDLITKKFDIESLLTSIRALKQQQQRLQETTVTGTGSDAVAAKKTGKNRLNVIVAQIEQIETPEQQKTTETDEQLSTLRCTENHVIRIESATLTDKDYETKCSLSNTTTTTTTQQRIVDALVELNDTCLETERTTELTGKLCNGKNECELDLSIDFAKVCDCTQKKYIDVTYTCVEQPAPTRSKRALNYRNSDYEMAKESAYRQRMARAEGLDQFLSAYGDVYYAYDNVGPDYYPYDYYYYNYGPVAPPPPPRRGGKGGKKGGKGGRRP